MSKTQIKWKREVFEGSNTGYGPAKAYYGFTADDPAEYAIGNVGSVRMIARNSSRFFIHFTPKSSMVMGQQDPQNYAVHDRKTGESINTPHLSAAKSWCNLQVKIA